MQKNHFILLSAASVLLLTSCSGKLGALSADNFTVTPNPLETQVGKVPATVNGSIGQGTNPFTRPQYILLNLALGGTNGGPIDNEAFPMRYEIDYVRVYEPIK